LELTYGLPPALSLVSGINAIAHAVEALYAREANPVISNLAEQGIAALGRALPRIVSDPADRDARSDALFGAWACGSCLGAVGCHCITSFVTFLGGTFGLPHAETHTVILPHAAAYNTDAAPAALRRVADALGANEAAAHCSILQQGMARRLRCGRSGCRSPTSTRQPMRRCSRLTGIRVPSSEVRSAPFLTTLITAGGRRGQERDDHDRQGGKCSGGDSFRN